MTKILFIGDPHIRHTHLTEGVKLLRWIEQIIEESNPDLVVNLGDTFDLHATIRSDVLCEVTKHIDMVCDGLKKPMVMVLGNHDMWKPNDYRYHALQVFEKRHNNLYIVDKHIQMDGVSYIPYLYNNIWPKSTASIAVTHNTFIGADYGYRTAQDGIHASDVQADIVVSGHIHKRQQLESAKILYPGTPMAISASDADQIKGLLLFETSNYEQHFIHSPFPIWRNIVFNIGDGDLGDIVNNKDYWIVTLKGPRAEIKSFMASKTVKELRSATSISFKTESTDTIKVDRISIKTSNLDTMVDQYIDRIYTGTQDKQSVKKTIKSVLEADK